MSPEKAAELLDKMKRIMALAETRIWHREGRRTIARMAASCIDLLENESSIGVQEYRKTPSGERIFFDNQDEYLARLGNDWTNNQDRINAYHSRGAVRYAGLAGAYNAVAQSFAAIGQPSDIWFALARSVYFIHAEHRRHEAKLIALRLK